MQTATVFDNENRLFYKAILDKEKGYYAVSSWPICKKSERFNNKRVSYYRANDVFDLLGFMATIAPFRQPKETFKDDGTTYKRVVKKPWFWRV